MNRYEFMRQLEVLLSDVSPTERSEAIQFYNDYFDDAGAENEQEVIRALGSPAKVAGTIKADLTGGETGEFTETGYRDFYNRGQEIVTYKEAAEKQSEAESCQGGEYSGGYQRESYQSNGNENSQDGTYSYHYQNESTELEKREKKHSTGEILLFVILCIFAAPIVLPLVFGIITVVFGLAIGAFGIVIGLVAGVVSLLVGVGATAIVLVVAGIALLLIGVVKMFVSPFGGLSLAGSGLICTGIGVLLGVFCVWACVKAVPMLARGVKKLWGMVSTFVSSFIRRMKGDKQ